MPRRRTLTLSEDQHQQLSHHRDHDPRPYVRERCAALLKVADGQSPHAVACHGLAKEDKVPKRDLRIAAGRMARFKADPERHTFHPRE